MSLNSQPLLLNSHAITALLAEQAIKGFLPEREAQALFDCAVKQAQLGPLLEVGSYCGKSTVYLGYAAQSAGQMVFSVDHHLGSEEHQPGEQYHDSDLFDVKAQRFDTLPALRHTLRVCNIEKNIIPIVARSEQLAAYWATPLAFIFIDGGHSAPQAKADCLGWAKHLMVGGIMAIHDIFERPEDGGQAPYWAMQAVMAEFNLVIKARTDSLVFLQRAE